MPKGLWAALVIAAAAPARGQSAPPRVVKLAAPGLTTVKLSPEMATFCNEHLAQQLTQRGFRVVTANEIQTLLGIERQKQLLGCTDQNSCMAELANALGVDGLVTGSVGKFGKSFQVNLKVLSATNLDPLGTYSVRAKGEEAMLDELGRGAQALAQQVFGRLGLSPAPVTPSADAPTVAALSSPEPAGDSAEEPPTGVEQRGAPGAPRVLPWVAVGGGAVALGAGGFFYAQALGKAERLRTGGRGLPGEEAAALAAQGQTEETLGLVLGAVGLLAAGVGVVLLAAPDGDPPMAQATLGWVQDGPAVLVSGVVP